MRTTRHYRETIGDAGGIHDGAKEVQSGALVVLPSSFIGADRWMRQKMQDIIATSNNLGFPDIFLIMTCNPYWKEILENLEPGQSPQDRPELCNRMF